MSEPTLFDAPAHPGALPASREQGHRIRASTADKRYAILGYLYGQVASYTADEIGLALGLAPLSVRPRVSELVRVGWVEDAGLRRPSAGGGIAGTLRITGRGATVLQTARRTDDPTATVEECYREGRGHA